MPSERDPPSLPPETAEPRVDISETEVRGAVRVGLIRQLLISIAAAVVIMGTVWVMNVIR